MQTPAWRSLAWTGLALCGAVAVVALLPDAEANHYRGGTLQWHRVEATGPTAMLDDLTRISLTGQLVYRTTFYYPTAASATVGDIIPGWSCCDNIAWGDGTSRFDMLVEEVDVAADNMVVRIVAPGTTGPLTHTYRTPNNWGTPYTVSWSTGDRLNFVDGHMNNPEGWYRLETKVDLLNANHSPEATPIVLQVCHIGTVCTFPIVATDPDGEAPRYRLSTSAEAAGYVPGYDPFVQPGPPAALNAATIDAATGIVAWDTRGAALSATSPRTYYSMQVMVVDNKTNVPLDFLIRLDPRPEPVLALQVVPIAAGCGSVLYRFEDRSVPPLPVTIVAWWWELGDGATATTKDATHAYPPGRSYAVQLILTFSDGATARLAFALETLPLGNTGCGPPPVESQDPRPSPEPPRDQVEPGEPADETPPPAVATEPAGQDDAGAVVPAARSADAREPVAAAGAPQPVRRAGGDAGPGGPLLLGLGALAASGLLLILARRRRRAR
jgi:hypothetical protein